MYSIIKQLLNSVFVICGIIMQGLGKCYLDLDNSAYHKNLIQ